LLIEAYQSGFLFQTGFVGSGKWFRRSPCDDLQRIRGDFRVRQILLKKSLSPDKRKFLGPLMRFAHEDVRDHIISGKKQPPIRVSAPRSFAATESAKNRLSRDFWRRLIFDFFDSIDPPRTWQRSAGSPHLAVTRSLRLDERLKRRI